ncbi:MAG: pentapeptide repeat-containing protein [Hyphomonadaceae bacterium]
MGASTHGAVLTQFRLVAIATVALGAAWASQAFAFWPFSDPTRLPLAPVYAGVCEECDLSGRILTGARMSNAVFNRADFSGAVLARADATNSEFEAADFSEADLSGAKLVDAHCPRANFEGATMESADARGADFTSAAFARADVTDMNFDRADLSGADLRHVRGLTQSQLDEACGDARTRLPRGMRVERCG